MIEKMLKKFYRENIKSLGLQKGTPLWVLVGDGDLGVLLPDGKIWTFCSLVPGNSLRRAESPIHRFRLAKLEDFDKTEINSKSRPCADDDWIYVGNLQPINPDDV